MMMSRCFTWFPNCLVLGEPNLYHNLVDFTRIGDFTWRVSDCEELVVGYSQEMMGWSCGQKNSRSTSKIVPA